MSEEGKTSTVVNFNQPISFLHHQILGKKGHSLSWLTGISNPYIRVSLLSNDVKECNAVLASQILNLPLNPKCQLNGLTKENIKDCFLKFVVLDFDRFSRSEFVAEVLITLGDLENLNDGVTVCEDLILQQKVMVRKRGACFFYSSDICSINSKYANIKLINIYHSLCHGVQSPEHL